MKIIRTTKTQKASHLKWLKELTSIPTAAGREHRVIAWVDDWIDARKDLATKRDRYGNIMISIKRTGGAAARPKGRPLLITAHLDHPAFVVQDVIDARNLRLAFRGGINKVYFDGGRVIVHDANGRRHKGKIIEHHGKGDMFDEVTVRLSRASDAIVIDDIATWDLPKSAVKKGILHAPACDDLAGVAAALSTLDVLRRRKKTMGDVRVLLTRAEEVGFVGCLAACDGKMIPKRARILALETSRSFAESPIGGGPIVRVGDRLSVFHHGLNHLVCQVAQGVAEKDSSFVWQRKLMAGGACEATAFLAWGFEATCLCLPLGHYHNMGDIDRVLAGTNRTKPRAGSEYISVADYHGLVDLLATCGGSMTGAASGGLSGEAAIRKRLESLLQTREFVLTEPAAKV